MKTRFLVIIMFLFLQKGHSVFGATHMEISHESMDQKAKTECDNYFFSKFKPILNHFVYLETEINENDELKRQVTTMRETVKDLQSQIKIKEEHINAKEEALKGQRDNLQNRDEQISDLRNHIKSLENTLSERSNQLAECRETEVNLPDSCPNGRPNGIYQIQIRGMDPFKVPCVSSPSGWTVILRRIDGSENFDRNWTDYKNGFGNVRGEFFIGLEKLHRMTTAQPHELYIKLGKVDGSKSYAKYDHFIIGSEKELYELKKLGTYSGEAGDSLKTHLHKKFTTFDRDNDDHDDLNCAANRGGWWYYDCARSKLTGKFYDNGHNSSTHGISWASWHDYDYTISLTFAEMMIRPKSL
ncbi:fibrinogen-like protein 1 [Drosophila subpulchrella]|uniref:fibrinogen-like protein 1 n=1 Tax=Drosophila subpulchrella TaxID=1486046 RepID=UPI0018A19641|nr:fibrinogen-like protein 1 [Drosophila subpulchrella]